MTDDLTRSRWAQGVISTRGPASATTRYVLACIGTYANPQLEAFPSTKTLAAVSGLSERAVVEHIQLGIEAGWLVRESVKGEGQSWRRSQYRLVAPFDIDPKKRADARSAPSFKKRADARSAPSHETPKPAEGADFHAEGADPHAKGADPDSVKVLTVRQSKMLKKLNKKRKKKREGAREHQTPSPNEAHAERPAGAAPAPLLRKNRTSTPPGEGPHAKAMRLGLTQGADESVADFIARIDRESARALSSQTSASA